MFFLQYPSMSSTPTPVWIFSGIAHFGEFRPKTYSFTENCECPLKSSRGLIQKTIQKMPKNYQNLDIFTPNFLWLGYKKRGGGSSLVREPVSQYSCSVRIFLKLMIKIEHIKMIQLPSLDIWSMLLSGQVPHRRNSSHLFWNLKDLVLVQTLS